MTLLVVAIAFVESLIATASIIAAARGQARMSAGLDFVLISLSFTVVKLAGDVPWWAVPVYAASFAAGTYLGVRYMEGRK